MRKISAPLSLEQAENQLARAISFNQAYLDGQPPRCLSWAICNDQHQFVGTQGLVWHTPDAQEAEIGIMLTQRASGKGFPVEAMGALTDFGLLTLGLEQIFANFDPANIAVERFVKKLGYRVDQALIHKDNQSYKYCVIDRSAWLASQHRVEALSADTLNQLNQNNG